VRRHLAVLLVAALVVAGFAIGLMRPARASTPPAQVNTVQSRALVCMWVPVLNIGLC
jgi:hypothetical protein